MNPAARVARARLVPVGDFPRDMLEKLSWRTGLPIIPTSLDPAPAYHAGRDQYDSTRLLIELKDRYSGAVLGATALDLFIPVLTFVFGEAELAGRVGVFSICRLREEFYGMPPNQELLVERAVRELLHELGHMAGLVHCQDAACVMSPAHSVEQVDVRDDTYCLACTRWLERRRL